MPESKARKTASDKKKQKRIHDAGEKHQENSVKLASSDRGWVPVVASVVALLGVVWLVVSQLAGQDIGFMRALGNWNIGIAMGLVVVSMGLFTQWK
ncbi:cell division protein CrgA [Tessaracoccus caeni]|uniref:cell division protein CrgA n=1 Tax=Tessaracoccus caeni TaxID=3031239 RepID=UPI0023DB69E1|nr:cell division protein CrgA [Tessaracoccus caeni]MDF1487259.1 cell division protein CrgA [Tessaracoccus caeni]